MQPMLDLTRVSRFFRDGCILLYLWEEYGACKNGYACPADGTVLQVRQLEHHHCATVLHPKSQLTQRILPTLLA